MSSLSRNRKVKWQSAAATVFMTKARVFFPFLCDSTNWLKGVTKNLIKSTSEDWRNATERLIWLAAALLLVRRRREWTVCPSCLILAGLAGGRLSFFSKTEHSDMAITWVWNFSCWNGYVYTFTSSYRCSLQL